MSTENVAQPAPDVGGQLASIQAKLDDIQRELESRNRRLAELEELQRDLTGIVNDVMHTAIVELDEVAPFMKTGDFSSLIKKLLRNTSRISESLSHLESAGDFVADVQPIGHDLFDRFIRQLDELERKGYFRVGGELQNVLDALVRTLAEKDVLPAVNRSLEAVSHMESDQFEGYSLWKLYRDTKTPEVRRLMAFCSTLLKTLARELNATPSRNS